MSQQRVTVVVNPAAGGGAMRARLEGLSGELRRHIPGVEIALTRGPGDGSRVACEAAAGGTDAVVAVGGDGSLSDVVDGVIRSGRAGSTHVGVLPGGTGGDFRRLLAADLGVERLAAALRTADSTRIDAGRVEYVHDDGTPGRSRHFINITSFGISGLVDRYVNASRKRLGGKLTYLTASLRALTTYRSTVVALRIDGRDVGEVDATTVAVCNGQFFGGSMHIAPAARLDDGLLDLIVVPWEPPHRSLRTLSRVYSGRHLDGKSALANWQGKRIEVTPRSGDPALVDIDGESPGRAPLVIEVMPAQIAMLAVRKGIATT